MAPCKSPHCQLNDELLQLLPALEGEQQQQILRGWAALDVAERDRLLSSIREPVVAQVDLATLSRLADYFQCGVYDVVRYTEQERGA